MWRCLQLTFLRRFCSTICVNKFSAWSTFSILCTFFFHFSTVRVCIVALYCTCPQLYTFLWQFLYRLFTLPSFPSCFPFDVELCKNATTQIKVCGWIPGSAVSLGKAVPSYSFAVLVFYNCSTKVMKLEAYSWSVVHAQALWKFNFLRVLFTKLSIC